MRLDIVLWPDPVLLAGTKPVERVDARLREVVAEMRRVMFELKGVGLAAPQVGEPLRLMLICPTGEPGTELVLVNPRIVASSGSQLGEEGCLSFPGIFGRVERAQNVRLAYQDLDGRAQELPLEGFVARIVQHENDHLDGRIFVDRMLAEDRLEAEPQLAELRALYAASSAAGRR